MYFHRGYVSYTKNIPVTAKLVSASSTTDGRILGDVIAGLFGLPQTSASPRMLMLKKYEKNGWDTPAQFINQVTQKLERCGVFHDNCLPAFVATKILQCMKTQECHRVARGYIL